MVVSLRHVRSLVFYIGFAFVVGHELDAVAQEEWRLLPLFDSLPDDTAYIVFVASHVPLLACLMWLTAHPSFVVRYWSRIGVDCFLIVHAALHLFLSGNALYTFHSSLSTILIFGGAAIGFLHILLNVRDGQQK